MATLIICDARDSAGDFPKNYSYAQNTIYTIKQLLCITCDARTSKQYVLCIICDAWDSERVDRLLNALPLNTTTAATQHLLAMQE